MNLLHLMEHLFYESVVCLIHGNQDKYCNVKHIRQLCKQPLTTVKSEDEAKWWKDKYKTYLNGDKASFENFREFINKSTNYDNYDEPQDFGAFATGVLDRTAYPTDANENFFE